MDLANNTASNITIQESHATPTPCRSPSERCRNSTYPHPLRSTQHGREANEGATAALRQLRVQLGDATARPRHSYRRHWPPVVALGEPFARVRFELPVRVRNQESEDEAAASSDAAASDSHAMTCGTIEEEVAPDATPVYPTTDPLGRSGWKKEMLSIEV